MTLSCLLITGTRGVSGKEPAVPKHDNPKPRHSAPERQYLSESEARRIKEAKVYGNGIILLDVDPKTGKVLAARMLVTTGNRRYDEAAIEGFRQARFRPGTPKQVRVPITFIKKR